MTVIISLAILLLSGFIATRFTQKLRLPNVTGYIFAGVIIGPYFLDLIPREIISGMDFVTDIALAFIAFGVGRYLKLAAIKESGVQVIIITVCEALIAAAVVSVVMIYFFKLPVSFSLLLGAIGSATAPASTIMTIRQYKAKSNFVNVLLQVVALDDAVALVAFSMCAAVAQTINSGIRPGPSIFLYPIALNIFMIILGIVFAFIFDKVISERSPNNDRLILTIVAILLLTGICAVFDVSPLLSCMAFGTTYLNKSHDKKTFKQVNNFAQPILPLFFVLSGMRLNIPALRTAGLIGLVYFFVRIVGKYIGACTGASIGRASPEVRKYLGLALIPQAGVSIGLAMLGQRILPQAMGSLLSTIILSSSVLYEMIGPAAAKLALHLSNSLGNSTKVNRKP